MSEAQQMETIPPMVDEIHEHVESQSTPQKCLVKKAYKQKNGIIKQYEYDQSKYNNIYYMNNKVKLTTPINCNCGNIYTLLNKSNHLKGKIHKLYERLTNTTAN